MRGADKSLSKAIAAEYVPVIVSLVCVWVHEYACGYMSMRVGT